MTPSMFCAVRMGHSVCRLNKRRAANPWAAFFIVCCLSASLSLSLSTFSTPAMAVAVGGGGGGGGGAVGGGGGGGGAVAGAGGVDRDNYHDNRDLQGRARLGLTARCLGRKYRAGDSSFREEHCFVERYQNRNQSDHGESRGYSQPKGLLGPSAIRGIRGRRGED